VIHVKEGEIGKEVVGYLKLLFVESVIFQFAIEKVKD
jgi:hypothetical protein